MILIIAIAILMATPILYLVIKKAKENKSLKAFISKWCDTLIEGCEDLKKLSDPNVFISDRIVANFCNKYEELVTSYDSLKISADKLVVLEAYANFCQEYKGVDQLQYKNNLLYFQNKLYGIDVDFKDINDKSRFVSHHALLLFEEKWLQIIREFGSLKDQYIYKYSLSSYEMIKGIVSIFEKCNYEFNLIRTSNNSIYTKQEKHSCAKYFDSIFPYSLDEQQRDAIVCNEDNTLVVSSAGSGKTSTIIGKVKYLIERKGVSPDKILVLTYTRKAAEELRERVGDDSVECSTFHRHSMKTIADVTGAWPAIAEPSLLYNVFRDLLKNNKSFFKAVNKYNTDYANLLKDNFEYSSAKDFFADKQKYGIKAPYCDRSGQVKFVRSKQELEIFIILTHLGVSFTYEEEYCYNTSDRGHRQYKPDFTIYYEIPSVDEFGHLITITKRLYYEHFGIDENGNVPKWFGDGIEGGYQAAQQKYTEGILWKRNVHDQNHTDLIQTTSADFFREPDMEAYIKRLLQSKGVPVNPISEEDKHRLLIACNPNVDEDLFKLSEAFILLMKANNKTVDEVLDSIAEDDEYAERNRYVLENIIRHVYSEYQLRLAIQGQIDFTDSLLNAAKLCNERSLYDFEYILVDEFQDMSLDKYTYLISLRSKTRYTPIFCVGDDWQSIYRFSGSDMTLFYNFEQHFGYTQKCKLETTHRFGNPLLSLSSEFIQRNPEQEPKEIKTTSEYSSLVKFVPYGGVGVRQKVEDIVSEIPADESIYVLGRYSYTVKSLIGRIDDDANNKGAIKIQIAGRTVTFMTVHSSKGLEADNVVILQCNGGVHGFPSMITDDPILNYVLSGADGYENAEERRVFYVAITRARKRTYCLYDSENPSVFMNEFGVMRAGGNSTPVICPRCGRGYVKVIKDGKSRNDIEFMTVACTNPMCDYFETLFGNNVNKYKARSINGEYQFPVDNSGRLKCEFHTIRELYPLECFEMIGKLRNYIVITKKNSRKFSGIPLFLNNGIELNEKLIADLKNQSGGYYVAIIQRYSVDVLVLCRLNDQVYCTDELLSEMFCAASGYSMLNGSDLDDLLQLIRLGLANPFFS